MRKYHKVMKIYFKNDHLKQDFILSFKNCEVDLDSSENTNETLIRIFSEKHKCQD